MSVPIRILIADDDAGMTQTLADILEAHGHEVVTEGDGEQAVARAREGPFDCIFLDIKMEGLNGVEVLRAIRHHSPDALVVMMTAYSEEDLHSEALAECALAVLIKPLDIDRVLGLIAEVAKKWPVLIVDDDRDFSITLMDALEGHGCPCASAASIEEALRIIARGEMKVIFLDMKLNAISGFEAFITLKRAAPGLAFILMTGYRVEMQEEIEMAMANHAVGCLFKPFDPAEAVRLVEGVRRKRLRELAAA